MKKFSELKALSKTLLTGNYYRVILSFILIGLASSLGDALASAFFSGDTMFQLVLNQCFAFVIGLIVSVLNVGLIYMMLNISRGIPPKYADLVYFYLHHPDKVIIVSFVFSAVQYVCTLPSTIYYYQVDLVQSVAEIDNYALFFQQYLIMYLLMGIGMAIAAVLTLPFAFSYFLLADDPEIDAGEALRISMKMMHGHYWRYIFLNVSFVGMLLLGLCSLGIGLLWIQPYIQMTQIQFYRDLKGELDAQQADENMTREDPSPDLEGFNAEA